MIRAICFCALLACTSPVVRGEVTTFANPLDVVIADPFVLRHDGTYYLYGTTEARVGFQVWSSTNLVDWREGGYAYRKSDGDFGRSHFWAPEAFEHNGKFYLHYTASSKDFSQRIVLAEGDSPLGPFKEVKAPWFQSDMCVIDSHLFKDTDGQLYLYYVLDCSENGDSEIHVRKVSNDLVVSSDATLCVEPSQPWEGTIWNEAPFVFKHGDTYILTYSANGYIDTFYNVGYATAPSPLGPWTKAPENPVLTHTKQTTGPGHNAFIQSPDGKELFIVYHTQQLLTGGPKRHLAIDRARMVEGPGGRPRLVVTGPTNTPQPLPSGADVVEGASDPFSGKELGRWWTIFNESPSRWSLDDGFLEIETRDGDVFEERTDLFNLFLQYAPAGDFTVTTGIRFRPEENYQHASLYVWQDHNHYAKLALVHDDGLRLEAAREVGLKYEKKLTDADGEQFLRIRKTGKTLTFYASRDGKRWRKLEATFDVDFHDLKVGIAAGSPAAGPARARFDFFRVEPATPARSERKQ